MAEEKDVKTPPTEESKAEVTSSVDSTGSNKIEPKGDFSEMADLEGQIAQSDADDTATVEASKEEKKESATEQNLDEVTHKESEKVESEEKVEGEGDEIDPELLKETFGETKKESGQTVEQEIAELKRKNAKMYEEMKKQQKEPASPPPMTEQQVMEAFAKDYPDMTPEMSKELFKFHQDWHNQVTMPAWDKRIAEEKVKTGARDDLKKNPFYKHVEKDIDKFIAEDEIAQSLPEYQRDKYAMQTLVARKLPELMKKVGVKAQKQALDNKRLIPANKPAVSVPKSKPKSAITLTKDDQVVMKRMDLTEDDLKTYPSEKTIIED